MHINTVKIGEVWVSYDLENVKATDRSGRKEEKIQVVATFKQNGKCFHKVYNLRSPYFDRATVVSKLFDNDYAKEYAVTLVEISKKSKHSPFHNRRYTI